MNRGARFVSQLNRLIQAQETNCGQRLRNRDIADMVAAAGSSISIPYVSQLRHGHRYSPSPPVVEALATAFGVTPEFFDISTHCAADSDDSLLARLIDPGLRRLLRAASGLSMTSLRRLIDFTDRLRTSAEVHDAPAS